MGDAQVFARTAATNADVASFFTKWMHDVADAQSIDGGFPDVAPRIVDEADGAPGWGDAGVIVPWVVYEHYADRHLVEAHFDAMARWVDYIDEANADHIWRERRNNDMGDWLSIDADSPKDVVATSFFAHSATLVGRMAAAIGRHDAAARYEDLARAIRAAYVKAFVADDGTIAGGTQTVYALALRFDLLPADRRAAAAGHLVADVDARGGRLSTGFLGVAHLLPALTDADALDTAYQLLHQDAYPSWLYAIRHGATTIWERWDGWTADRGFQDPGMNSFNHYAFGAVGEWLYETVAGLRPDPAHPGFEHFFVAPRPGGELSWAELHHDSLRGPIRTRWERDGSRFMLELAAPPNTHATVRIPTAPTDAVTEGGLPLDRVEGLTVLGRDDSAVTVAVGAGTYVFTSELGS
jgi:alpha-L-rhamnosidase